MRCHTVRCFKHGAQLLLFLLLVVLLVIDVPLPDTSSRDDEIREAFKRLQVALAPTDIRSEESLANDSTPQRLARMRKVCEASPDLRTKKGPVYGNLMADVIFHTVTCVPAKVSSTDWKYLMFKLHMFKYPRPQYDQKLHKANILSEVNISYFSDNNKNQREVFLKSYYKYVVVRHPWVRLVAGYKELFEETQLELVKVDSLVRQIKNGFDPLGESGTPRVLFHEYVQYVLSNSRLPADMDRRWMPMRYACEPCLVKYDFLVKLENLDLDMLGLFYAINVTGHKVPYFGSIVKPDQPVSKIMPYFVNVSESDYMQLSNFYKSDFDLFGYTAPKRPTMMPSQMEPQDNGGSNTIR